MNVSSVLVWFLALVFGFVAQGATTVESPVGGKADATHNGYLNSADWSKFNAAAGGGISSVTGTPPVASSGGSTPAISMAKANGTTNGYLGSTDWGTFNSRQIASLTANYVWAGNASNTAESTNTNLLGDVKAGAANQTVTMTIASQFVVTAVSHGLSLGDKIYFTTTGALPTGISASTTYYAAPSNANALHVATSLANAQSSTFIDTSGSQSGVHTMYSGGLVLKTLQTASFTQLGLTGNGHTLTLQYGGTPAADYTWKLPTAAPVTGQFLAVTDTTNSPSMVLGWGNPAGGNWHAPVKCVATAAISFVWAAGVGGDPQCDNGYHPVEGDRVLEAYFADVPEQEGIFVLDNMGNYNRAPDAATAADYNAGIAVQVANSGSPSNGDVYVQRKAIGTLDSFGGGGDPQQWDRLGSSPAGVGASATGVCTIASSTLSTTAANKTCTGVPASASVAVSCSGAAAFSTPTAGGLYCRATGVADQVACNTAVANTTAMAFTCTWAKP